MHASLWDDFVARAGAVARVMRQAPPLNGEGNTGVDMGALVLPGEARRTARATDLVRLRVRVRVRVGVRVRVTWAARVGSSARGKR